MNAPIVVFAFNRFEPFTKLIESLKSCPEHSLSRLFVFIDGPRDNSDKQMIERIRCYAETVTGFESVEIQSSETNWGLGPSIITGVSEIVGKYGRVIVLEDDLIVHPMFLKYMNEALCLYEDHQEVFSICGYTNKINPPIGYGYNTYFGTRSSSWGWATWRSRWESVDWNLSNWSDYIKLKSRFNRWGGSDCFSMLEGWKKGLNKSWAIRFCFAEFLQDRISLFPIKSLVSNNGFDGSGTNCKKWSRFEFEMMPLYPQKFTFPDQIKVNKNILEQCLSYHSIAKRIYSRLMYLIYR